MRHKQKGVVLIMVLTITASVSLVLAFWLKQVHEYRETVHLLEKAALQEIERENQENSRQSDSIVAY